MIGTRVNDIVRKLLPVVAVVLMLWPWAARGQEPIKLPPDFKDEVVAQVGKPTGMAWTPDGRMLITTQRGKLRVLANGALVENPALDLSGRVCPDNEQGLLGVAVDPNFASNQYIYLYYTFAKFGGCEQKSERSPVNRVVRFTLPPSNVIDPATEKILIDNIPSPGGLHNAGDLQFGKDGFLYISVGDGQCDYAGDSGCWAKNNAARDEHALVGKILRITADGDIPPTNPNQGPDSARCNTEGRTTPGKKCQETFAWGLRNPFRIAFDPNAADTRFLINDVGEKNWEEINEGKAGADYGWNDREGACSRRDADNCNAAPPNQTPPLFAYDHSGVCGTITGGAFVPRGIWPASFDGAYLFADWRCGQIFQLPPNAKGPALPAPIVSELGIGSITAMRFGPNGDGQALYYSTLLNDGQIHRIVYTGTRTNSATSTTPPASRTNVALQIAAIALATFGVIAGTIWGVGRWFAARRTNPAATRHSLDH